MYLVELNSHPGGWPHLSSYLLFPAPLCCWEELESQAQHRSQEYPQPWGLHTPLCRMGGTPQWCWEQGQIRPWAGAWPPGTLSGPRSLSLPPGKMWLRDPAGSESQPRAGAAERQRKTRPSDGWLWKQRPRASFLLEEAGEAKYTCQVHQRGLKYILN